MSRFWIFLSAINLFAVSINCLTQDEIEAQRSGWNVDPNTQYHIQTDEGPERYFRYQTLNGQFRKEKRLGDGTVIGTEGWLDPLGYLRIQDYIADHEGFRILKSKMVFVGKDRPIDEAVAASKRVPAQSGILAKRRRPPNPFRQQALHELTDNSIETNTIKPAYSSYSSSNSISRYVPSSTTAYQHRSTYDSTTIRPIAIINHQTPEPVTNNYIQNYPSYQRPYRRPYNKAYPFVQSSAVNIEQPVTTWRNKYHQSNKIQVIPESTYGLYRPDRRYRAALASERFNKTTGRQQITRRRPSVYANSRADSQAVDSSSVGYYANNSRARQRVPSSRTSSVASTEEFPAYDGTHTSADGFQYYLKSHYHEEEMKPDKNIGSYGYVDPFGIRRVVYYQADKQNGFVHKKNNRYVGFNATPYDPVPPKIN